MPVIKSAIKKLRQDKKREKQNKNLENKAKQLLRSAEKKKSGKAVSEAISIVDKLAKKKIIHKNKASRMKASLSKIAKPVKAKVQETPKKPVATKTAKKPQKKTTK